MRSIPNFGGIPGFVNGGAAGLDEFEFVEGVVGILEVVTDELVVTGLAGAFCGAIGFVFDCVEDVVLVCVVAAAA